MIKAVHKGKTSIREVASAAGVSVVTVSAALNGGKNVSDRKRLEIQQLAREMGYKPNAAARLLKSKKIDDFGLLIFERVELIRENAMFMDFTVQFMRECTRHEISFQMEWFDCYHNPDRIPAILTNGMVGGLLIAGAPGGASKDYINNESRLPRVHVGEAGEYSVNMDPSEQFRQAIYYLISMGHKEIGMINGPLDINPFSQLRNVFNSTLKEVGIEAEKMYFNVNYPHGSFARQVEDCFEHLMQAPKLPSALFVQSGLFCKGFISRLAHAGIRVPEDISIVCFGTSDWEAEKYFPAITAIENRNDEIIAPAVSMLKDLVDGREVHRKNILVQAGFTKRDTVAPFGKIR